LCIPNCGLTFWVFFFFYFFFCGFFFGNFYHLNWLNQQLDLQAGGLVKGGEIENKIGRTLKLNTQGKKIKDKQENHQQQS